MKSVYEVEKCQLYHPNEKIEEKRTCLEIYYVLCTYTHVCIHKYIYHIHYIFIRCIALKGAYTALYSLTYPLKGPYIALNSHM